MGSNLRNDRGTTFLNWLTRFESLTLDKITSALALSYLAQSYALRLKDLILDHERNAYV
jgi:hypothetical protein